MFVFCFFVSPSALQPSPSSSSLSSTHSAPSQIINSAHSSGRGKCKMRRRVPAHSDCRSTSLSLGALEGSQDCWRDIDLVRPAAEDVRPWPSILWAEWGKRKLQSTQQETRSQEQEMGIKRAGKNQRSRQHTRVPSLGGSLQCLCKVVAQTGSSERDF